MSLYSIFISPIESLIDFCLNQGLNLLGSYGLSIVLVSLIINFLLIPVYNYAHKLQRKEQKIKQILTPKIKRIQLDFSGEKKFAMLATHYRQNHYHPILSLRAILGLAIQIPFFIAAFHYFSNHTELANQSFLLIKDLSKEDGLILGVNLLPIMMTLINVLSAMVYSHQQSSAEKNQLLFISILFLILLYNSPSAVVLYWIINNLFSLLKNIYYEKKQNINTSILQNIIFQYKSYQINFKQQINNFIFYIKITPTDLQRILSDFIMLFYSLLLIYYFYASVYILDFFTRHQFDFVWAICPLGLMLLVKSFKSKNKYAIVILFSLVSFLFSLVLSKYNLYLFVILTFSYLIISSNSIVNNLKQHLLLKNSFHKKISFPKLTVNFVFFGVLVYIFYVYNQINNANLSSELLFYYYNLAITLICCLTIFSYWFYFKLQKKYSHLFFKFRLVIAVFFTILMILFLLDKWYLLFNLNKNTHNNDNLILINFLIILVLQIEKILIPLNYFFVIIINTVAVFCNFFHTKKYFNSTLFIALLISLFSLLILPKEWNEINLLSIVFILILSFSTKIRLESNLKKLFQKLLNAEIKVFFIVILFLLILLIGQINFTELKITKTYLIYQDILTTIHFLYLFIFFIGLIFTLKQFSYFIADKNNIRIVKYWHYLSPFIAIGLLIFVINPFLLIGFSSEITQIDLNNLLLSLTKELIFFFLVTQFVYYFCSNNTRIALIAVAYVIFFILFIYSFILVQNFGLLDNLKLKDSSKLNHQFRFFLVDYLILIAVVLGVYYLYLNKNFIKIKIGILSCLTVILAFSFFKLSDKINFNKQEISTQYSNNSSQISNFVSYSPNKKNIIVIMLDGFPGTLMYKLINEYPDLMKNFTGFTWYPNTLAAGYNTMTSLPSMLGGEDFLPSKMLKQQKNMVKQTQIAYQKLSKTIYNNNYEQYFFNPQYAQCNLLEYSTCFHHSQLKLNQKNSASEISKQYYQTAKLSSILKSFPYSLKNILYHSEFWSLQNIRLSNFTHKIHQIYFLKYFTQNVEINPNSSNNLKFLQIESPHFPWIYDKDCNQAVQTANAASESICTFKLLNDYILTLKEQGVYDNTKIILLSDHGQNWNRDHYQIPNFIDQENFSKMQLNKEKTLELQKYLLGYFEYANSLMLIKEMNNDLPFQVSENFISSADLLAIICSEMKCDQNLLDPTHINDITRILETTDASLKNEKLDIINTYRIKGNIFELNNWENYNLIQ